MCILSYFQLYLERWKGIINKILTVDLSLNYLHLYLCRSNNTDLAFLVLYNSEFAPDNFDNLRKC
jgi:hypothetical protein